METYKTVTGSEMVNAYIKLGWKRIHVFTTVIDQDENGGASQYDAAFVIVWDHPSEPVIPKRQKPPEAE